MSDRNDWYRDAELKPDIEFPHPVSFRREAPDAILLTGSTGFVGAYLLDELLRKTKARLYCLIRCEHSSAGLQRLEQHLETYGLWQENFRQRLVPLAGDLAQPRFGLAQPHFDALAEEIDVIYHNAAQVNALFPYTRLRASNVGGTEEILRFAGHTRTKPLHFISTLAVFFQPGNGGRLIPETAVPEWSEDFRGGYRQSKWVAESLVRSAAVRGLPTAVYRLGRIFGHSLTGFHGHRNEDLLCRVLKGCILIGRTPDVDTRINLAAVNDVSRAIVHLAQRSSSLGRTFHLCHPESVAFEQAAEVVRGLGYPLSRLPYPEWLAELSQNARKHAEGRFLSGLHLLLRTPQYLFADKPEFDARNTHAALAAEATPWTPIDRVLSATLRHMDRCRELPPAPVRRP